MSRIKRVSFYIDSYDYPENFEYGSISSILKSLLNSSILDYIIEDIPKDEEETFEVE